MSKRVYALVLLALFVITTGCATGSVQTARTNGAGNFQFGVEPGVFGFASTDGLGFLPAFNIAGRYGITDRLDIGARLGTVTYDVQAKIMLTDPAATDSLAMSIAPQVTAIGAGGSGGGGFWFRSVVPLLIGLPVGDSEFTFAPRVSPWFFGAGGGGESAGAFLLFVGGEAGFAARVGDKFWVMPHLAIDYPVVGAVTSSSGGGVVGGLGNGVVFGAGVGLLFGGRPRGSTAAPSAPPADTTME